MWGLRFSWQRIRSQASGLWHHVVMWCFKRAVLPLEQHGPPKHWHPTTSLHGVTTQKTSVWMRSLSFSFYKWQWIEYWLHSKSDTSNHSVVENSVQCTVIKKSWLWFFYQCKILDLQYLILRLYRHRKGKVTFWNVPINWWLTRSATEKLPFNTSVTLSTETTVFSAFAIPVSFIDHSISGNRSAVWSWYWKYLVPIAYFFFQST